MKFTITLLLGLALLGCQEEVTKLPDCPGGEPIDYTSFYVMAQTKRLPIGKRFRSSILRKLNCHSVTELVRYAVRNHIVEA